MTEKITAAEFRKKKPGKYRNVKVEYDGIKFDSIKECNRYKKLKLIMATGEITNITLQPKFDIIVNNVKCGFYKADFEITWKSGKVTIEDVKGMKTTVYQLKKRLVEAIYGITIIER